MILYKKDIPSPHWTFWDYVTKDGNPIEDWYQELSDEARNIFDGMLKNISKTEIPIQWIGWKRFLQGKLRSKRIWELAFKADKVQHRVLGIFGGERKQTIFLIGCYHKGRNYTPSDALETAYKRPKQFQAGKAGLHERKIKNNI